VLGIFLSFCFTTTAAALEPVNPVLSTDQTAPTTINSSQTFEFVDHRPYFNFQLRTMDGGYTNGYIAQPEPQRSGPDASGNYRFTVSVTGVPVNRPLEIQAAASDEPKGFCGGPPYCDLVYYYARAAGPPPNPFRDFGLAVTQRKGVLSSTYSFVAGAPAMVVNQITIYRTLKGKRRRLRRTTYRPRAAVYSPATAALKQKNMRSMRSCRGSAGARIRRSQQAGERLSYVATAYLLADGKRVGIKRRSGRLQIRC